MIEEISDRDLREIQRIQASIPEQWKKNITMKRKVSPNLSRDMRKIVKSPELSEEKRKEIQTAIDSGIFDRTEEVENKTVATKIAAYVARKQAQSIKAGRLSKPKKQQDES